MATKWKQNVQLQRRFASSIWPSLLHSFWFQLASPSILTYTLLSPLHDLNHYALRTMRFWPESDNIRNKVSGLLTPDIFYQTRDNIEVSAVSASGPEKWENQTKLGHGWHQDQMQWLTTLYSIANQSENMPLTLTLTPSVTMKIILLPIPPTLTPNITHPLEAMGSQVFKHYLTCLQMWATS